MVVVDLMGTSVDTKALTDLVKLLRKLGVSTYRTPELELILSDKIQAKQGKSTKTTEQYTDDDTLFWSSQMQATE
jgi:hypothetical protein